MGPVNRTGNEAMSGRIVMNIIDMAAVIRVVADGVLSKPPLPQDTPGGVARRQCFAGVEQALGEHRLYAPPTMGEVGIAIRECHDGVQMLRQNHDRVDFERPFRSGRPKGFAQGLDMDGQPP